jgi:hypothetical protein
MPANWRTVARSLSLCARTYSVTPYAVRASVPVTRRNRLRDASGNRSGHRLGSQYDGSKISRLSPVHDRLGRYTVSASTAVSNVPCMLSLTNERWRQGYPSHAECLISGHAIAAVRLAWFGTSGEGMRGIRDGRRGA